jgi:cell division ATPase FtsA
MKLPGWFFSKKKNGDTFAVCDIGSGSVAVAIVEVRDDNGSNSHILLSERRALSQETRGDDQVIIQLKTLIQETASSVLEKHSNGGGNRPIEVIASIHSPWVNSETMSTESKFEQPTLITSEIISSLAKEAAHKKTSLDSANIFERSVTRIELNGYPTSSPEGKYASRISVSVLESDIDTRFSSATKEALGAVFTGREITLHSAFFILNVVIHEYIPEISHYTLVDVTSRATSVAVVRNGALLEYAVAPIGWRVAVEKIATKQSTTPTEALSRTRMVGDDTCTNAECKAIMQTLMESEPDFVDAYGKMLVELSKSKRAPNTMILVTPPDFGGWFSGIFSRIDFAQFAVSENPFSVQQLFGSDIASKVVAESTSAEDTGIFAMAGFVHILSKDKTT